MLYVTLFVVSVFVFIIVIEFIQRLVSFYKSTLNVIDRAGNKKLVFINELYVEAIKWSVNGEEVTNGSDWCCTINNPNVPTRVEAVIVPKVLGLHKILPFLPKRQIFIEL